jgi:hypothetical protein
MRAERNVDMHGGGVILMILERSKGLNIIVLTNHKEESDTKHAVGL